MPKLWDPPPGTERYGKLLQYAWFALAFGWLAHRAQPPQCQFSRRLLPTVAPPNERDGTIESVIDRSSNSRKLRINSATASGCLVDRYFSPATAAPSCSSPWGSGAAFEPGVEQTDLPQEHQRHHHRREESESTRARSFPCGHREAKIAGKAAARRSAPFAHRSCSRSWQRRNCPNVRPVKFDLARPVYDQFWRTINPNVAVAKTTGWPWRHIAVK